MTCAADCVLGMDLGTGSLKCVVMDIDGRVLATAERAYPTQSRLPGWAEQHPRDWLAAMRLALAELAAGRPGLFGRIAALGICSAAHIPVLLDGADRVIRPAILWSDQRSGEEVAALRAEYGPLLESTTLNEASCTWTLPQLLWLAKHEPDAMARVRRFLSSKDYLIFSLTGEACMDFGSAAATLMLDAGTRRWAKPLTELSGLSAAAFPRLASPLAVVGTVTPAAGAAYGLPAGIPVIAGTLDSAAELVGCGILEAGGLGMVRVGSAGGIMATTDGPSFNARIITYPHIAEGVFYKQAGTNACATSLKWIRRLCSGAAAGGAARPSYEDLDELALTARPGADGLIFHPYLHGERAPYWNPDLRGNFSGIDHNHAWPHFVRAVMEGVAYSLRDCLDMFRREAITVTRAVMSGGVVKSPVWTQIVTDVLGIETHTVRDGDSARGACLLAATAAGMFGTLEAAAAACVVPGKINAPDPARRDLYARGFERYRQFACFFDAAAREPRGGGADTRLDPRPEMNPAQADVRRPDHRRETIDR